MSHQPDFKARLSRFKDATKPAGGSEKAAPQENGVRLATMKRGDDEELRVNWSEYNGKNFLSVRVWSRSGEAWFPMKEKGVTIRLHELGDFAEGVGRALDLAAEGKKQ